MIDATKITNYSLSEAELEEHIIFWLLAAGKNGTTTAKCLDNLLNYWWVALGDVWLSPFEIIQQIDEKGVLPEELKRFGIGCYNKKSEYLRSLVNSNLNLKTCSVDELESVKGCGPKTARCFLIHSRKNQKYAGLDTHVLKYMKDMGYKVPKEAAKLDLLIWNVYSGRDEDKIKNKKFLLSLK